MLFPTLEFAAFFLVALAGNWSLHRHSRLHRAWLLASSYLFYAFWDWRFVPLLFALSATAWLFARRIHIREDPRARIRLLVLGVASFVVVLGYFKYTGFLISLLPVAWSGSLLTGEKAFVNPVLPLGISFIVFHAISLLIDAYRGRLDRDPGLAQVLLYVAFFPQLIAGPILRASHFLPQIDSPRDACTIRITRALLLIALGLFKKVILANHLGTELVDPVFEGSHTESRQLQAVYGYAVQIYCDFSGYTDIATGCALLLGYRFPLNFRDPYRAASIQDFWRRWHITLSSWLRDYLYIPMGGSRRGLPLTLVFLMVTMLIGGLWHGAGWQFVFWGAFHGGLLVGHHLWAHATRARLPALRHSALWQGAGIVATFHLVCLGWIWFRAPDFDAAWRIVSAVGTEILEGRVIEAAAPWTLAAITLGLGMQFQPLRWRAHIERWFSRKPALVQGALFAIAVTLIEYFGPAGVAPFIYFQF